MSLLRVFEQFPDQAACIAHLENIRFGDKPVCPLCGSSDVARKSDSWRIGRWNCYGCGSSFNVLSGTLFQKTKIPLQKWFLAISLLLDAKKSISSYQLARHLNIRQQAAWFMLQRIRSEMVAKQSTLQLQGIVEADESYIGCRPSTNSPCKTSKSHCGRGTSKLAVLGVVQRDGQAYAQVADDLTGEGVLRFLWKAVDPERSHLFTDGFRSYLSVRPHLQHTVFKRYRGQFKKGIHTNTIEGFWACFKRSWYGTHHSYQRKYAFLYIAEYCYKYNIRNDPEPFGTFLKDCFALC